MNKYNICSKRNLLLIKLFASIFYKLLYFLSNLFNVFKVTFSFNFISFPKVMNCFVLMPTCSYYHCCY